MSRTFPELSQPAARRLDNFMAYSSVHKRISANEGKHHSEINWVIMDYLVSEGYPGAAEKFAQETNICSETDIESIRERVKIRHAIHAGKIDEAIGLVNEIDPEILDTNSALHFQLLQLQLVEIIRGILDKQRRQAATAQDFAPALLFAQEQLAPRAPTDPRYLKALEETMALMVYTPDKMPPEFNKLLDPRLRETVASDINKAILEARGERAEAKIRSLVRARAWAEAQARDSKCFDGRLSIGLDGDDGVHEAYGTDGIAAGFEDTAMT